MTSSNPSPGERLSLWPFITRPSIFYFDIVNILFSDGDVPYSYSFRDRSFDFLGGGLVLFWVSPSVFSSAGKSWLSLG